MSTLIATVCGESFYAPTFVNVKDVRLLAFHRVAQFLVLLYIIIIQLVLSHRYAAFEAPMAYGNIWAALVFNSTSWPSTPCNNPAYDWGLDFTADERTLSGGLVAGPNTTCTPFANDQHVKVGDNSFTAVSWTLIRGQNGTRSEFTLGVEEASLNMIHVFSASFLKSGVVNPHTVVRTKSGEVLQEFPAGAIMSGIKLQQWLRAAGISLDDRNIQPWIRGGAPSASPFFRLTGAVLLLSVKYSNLRTWELPSVGAGTPRADVTVEVLPNAWGFMGATPVNDPVLGPGVAYQTGVRLQFVFSGSVGTVSAFEIIMRFVEGQVLLGVALLVTRLLASYWIHRHSFDSVIAPVVTREHLDTVAADKVQQRAARNRRGKGSAAVTHSEESA